jgi:tellurite resistance protein
VRRVPISFFSMVMGTAGLGLAWTQASKWWSGTGIIGTILWLVAGALWLLVCASYLYTARRHPDQARGELLHHGSGVFAALAFMSLVLLTIPLHAYAPILAEVIWFAAAISQALLGAWLLNRWVSEDIDPSLITGGWLLPPTGGNLVSAIGAAAFGYPTLAYMFLGAGGLSWIFVNSLIFNRQVSHTTALSQAQLPTTFIQVAPPVLIINAVVPGLTKEVGPLVDALWGFALFVLIAILVSGRQLARMPFGPHWWAGTFPSAALALASIRISQFGHEPIAHVLAPTLLAFATCLYCYIAFRTVRMLRHGGLLPAVPVAAREA